MKKPIVWFIIAAAAMLAAAALIGLWFVPQQADTEKAPHRSLAGAALRLYAF